ncbi:FkbM family methyltransferase [Roseibium aggregatum]|uniref:FkbM family methyltransferase n=1 Tax=Roseibium aggregatum TaxID=187304 RepID=UPI001E3EBB5D|nr:FkbM family methyltransferase [Roseibium aggregatum]UES56794.1 FkbM family methyltransferase [Roseibium aggregatum]
MILEEEDLTIEKLTAHSKRGIYIIPDKMSSNYLARFEFSPDVVVDVGVHSGTDFLYELFPKTKTLLIDPFPGFEKTCIERFGQKYDFEYFHCAVGAAPGKSTLKVQGDNIGKSTLGLPTTMQGQNTREEFDVEVKTLDSICKNYAGKVGLKIDTEGHELEVLKGASDTLKRTEFIIAELSIKKRYWGGYRFSEVVSFLQENDFEIIDILNPIWRVHMFWDCLFVKKDSDLFKSRVI